MHRGLSPGGHGRARRNLPPARDVAHRSDLRNFSPSVRRAARVLRAFRHDAAQASDEHELLERLCSQLVRLGGYRMVWVGMAEDDRALTVRPVAHAGVAAGYLDGIRVSWGTDAFGRGPTGTAIRTREPIVAKNILTDPNFEPWRLEATKRGFSSSVAVPLAPPHGRCLGALNLYAAEPDSFRPQEIQMLCRLALEVIDALRALRSRSPGPAR